MDAWDSVPRQMLNAKSSIQIGSALALFVAGVGGTDDVDLALAADNLALFADAADAGANLHDLTNLPTELTSAPRTGDITGAFWPANCQAAHYKQTSIHVTSVVNIPKS